MKRAEGRWDMLDDLAALGPFFAVSSHLPETGPGPPWRPIRELTEPDGPLAGRIDEVRAALAGRAGRPAAQIEPRVAASVTHLGLVARLIAPHLQNRRRPPPGRLRGLRPAVRHTYRGMHGRADRVRPRCRSVVP